MPYMYGKINSRKRAKCYVKWSKTSKKYYYICGNKASRARAVTLAEAQRTAIFSSGWKGN